MEEIEKKRAEKQAQQTKKAEQQKQKEETIAQYKRAIKKGIITGLWVIAGVAGLGYAGHQTYKWGENKLIQKEADKISEIIKTVPQEKANAIRRTYDKELLSAIEAVERGEKCKGVYITPNNTTSIAHSELFYKYQAYNPDVYQKRSAEDWVLLEHMANRYYQAQGMKLPNRRGVKNLFAEKLRKDLNENAPIRLQFYNGHFTHALKMNEMMRNVR